MASDYVSLTALAPGLSKLSVEAPNMTFDIVKMADRPFKAIEQYDIDLLITSDLYISRDHPYEQWFCDDSTFYDRFPRSGMHAKADVRVSLLIESLGPKPGDTGIMSGESRRTHAVGFLR